MLRTLPSTARRLVAVGDGETPGIHLVPAYAPDVKAVVGQLQVDAKTNEHKAALELLGVLSVKGKIVSGDAMFTHRDVCAKVITEGGDYIFPVRVDQPTLRADIAAAFAQPEAGLSPLQTARAEAEIDRACEVDKGHGRVGGEPSRWDLVAGWVPWIGLAGLSAGLPPDAQAHNQGEDRDRGGLRDHESAAGAGRSEGVAGTDPRALGDRERPARGP